MINKDKLRIEIVIILGLVGVILFVTSYFLSAPIIIIMDKISSKLPKDMKIPKAGTIVIIDILAAIKVWYSIKGIRLVNKYANILSRLPNRTCTQDIARQLSTNNKKIVKQLSMLVRNHYFNDALYIPSSNSFAICGGQIVVFIGSSVPEYNDFWNNNGSAEMRNWRG